MSPTFCCKGFKFCFVSTSL